MKKIFVPLIVCLSIAALGFLCVLAPMGYRQREESGAWKEADLVKEYKTPYSQPTAKVIQTLDVSVRAVDGVIIDKIEHNSDDNYFGYARRYVSSFFGDVCLGSIDVRMTDGDARITFTLYPVIETGPRAGQMVKNSDIREVSLQWENERQTICGFIQNAK